MYYRHYFQTNLIGSDHKKSEFERRQSSESTINQESLLVQQRCKMTSPLSQKSSPSVVSNLVESRNNGNRNAFYPSKLPNIQVPSVGKTSAALSAALIYSFICLTLAQHQHEYNSSHTSLGGYLFADDSSSKLDSRIATDAKLKEILSREGPDLRTSADYKDFTDIGLNESIKAWALMHQRTSQMINTEVDAKSPLILKLLLDAHVSNECFQAINVTLDATRRLETWAIKLWNSWGQFPPAGMFDGALTDIGSYHQCLGVDKNPYIDHAHYCSVSYRPVIPSKARFGLIIDPSPSQLIPNTTSSIQSNGKTKVMNLFETLRNRAQYHHFVYYKIGTCVPAKCSPVDVDRVAHLLGQRSILMTGPTKCHTAHGAHNSRDNDSQGPNAFLRVEKWDSAQQICATILISITLFIVLMTCIDGYITYAARCKASAHKLLHFTSEFDSGDAMMTTSIELSKTKQLETIEDLSKSPEEINGIIEANPIGSDKEDTDHLECSSYLVGYVKDFSILANGKRFFTLYPKNKREIKCINGIRVITMWWIIIAHSLQYNDWSGFTRIYEIEKSITSLAMQPILNATYLVDSFFLISGLVASLSVWRSTQGKLRQFSIFNYVVGRYIRLTPQVMLTTMAFIVFPIIGNGPHWYNVTSTFAENCEKNWWVNLLHIQAFYRTDEICNVVSWWISVDMLFHLIGLFVLIALLIKPFYGAICTIGVTSIMTTISFVIHYTNGLPPNMFATIPQVAEMWSQMVIRFFWTPYSHAFAFFLGLWIGYLIASGKIKKMSDDLVRRSWIACIAMLITLAYSTHLWVIGSATYSHPLASIFYHVWPPVWSICISWIIIACHYGKGSFVNAMLSCRMFAVLGKASFIIYLSHMMVLFWFFGTANTLLEASPTPMLYLSIGNIFFSSIFGMALCIVYEMPCLQIHQRITRTIKTACR